MEKVRGILAAVGLIGCICCGGLLAEDRAASQTVRGSFVRLAEQQVGQREYLAVVVKCLEGKDQVTLLVPRGGELAGAARGLREGQTVEIGYVVEAGQKWVSRIKAEPRRDEKDAEAKPRQAAEGSDLAALWARVRQLESRLQRMEGELRELREANAHLRKRLEEKEPAKKEPSKEEPAKDLAEGKESDSPVLPDGMRGFRGMLRGTVTRRGDRSFVLKVEAVTKVWPQNKASNPQAAIGKEITIVIRPKSELGERHLQALRQLKPGDRAVVEAFHFEGNHLTVVEELKKVE